MRVIVSPHLYDYNFANAPAMAWWQGVFHHLEKCGVSVVTFAEALSPPSDSSFCMFGHICSYPLTHFHSEEYRVVALPVWDCPDFKDRSYRSRIIVRRDAMLESFSDLIGKRVAINSERSFSGHIALRMWIQDQQLSTFDRVSIFDEGIVTGNHIRSVDMVREGGADICICDGVTWQKIQKFCPERCAGLETIAYGPWLPGIPYVMSRNSAPNEVASVRQALAEACNDASLSDVRRNINLSKIINVDDVDYEEVKQLNEHRFDDEILAGGIKLFERLQSLD